jgi:branched-chain amino acid transport system substrate-binding protein
MSIQSLPQHPARRRFLRGLTWGTTAFVLSFSAWGCKSPEQQANGGSASGNGTSSTNNAATTANVGRAKPYSGNDILLGEYASLTGSTATFGISTDRAIKMAIAEANEKGGVLGRKVRLQVEDNASQTQQSASAVLKLINESNVLAVLGEVASSRSLAAAPICQAAGVPMLSPSSTNPKVTQVGDYIFRSCFIDPFQGKVMSTFARETLKAKRASILTDQANDYSKGLTQVFNEDWKKNGGEIVSTASYSEGDKDFRAQLTTIKASQPDVIFVPGYYTEVAAIANQARGLGITQTMLGGDGWDSPKLFEIGKSAVQGSYFSNHYSAQSKEPRVVKFVTAFQGRYKEVPDALAAVGYDAANIMLDAIKRASPDGKTIPTREQLRDALAKTKNFQGVTGVISIDANRNAQKPAVVLQVKGDEAVYVSTVKP